MISQICDTPKTLDEYSVQLLPGEAYVGERKARSRHTGNDRPYKQAEAVIRSLKYECGIVRELALIQYSDISQDAVNALMSIDIKRQKTTQRLRSIYISTGSDRYAHIYAGNEDAMDIIKYVYTDDDIQLVRMQFDGRYIATRELKEVLKETFQAECNQPAKG